MRPVLFAVGWASLMLAVTLAASGIAHDAAHDAAYIFARRRMTRTRVLQIGSLLVLAVMFMLASLLS